MTWARDDDDETVAIDDVVCIGATDRAIRVDIDGRLHWIPDSQVTDESEVYGLGHHGRLVVTAWFARKEGLE